MTHLPTLDDQATSPVRLDETTLPLGDLKIGDLAKVTGKTARALRLYEEMGLLTPGTRTAGGFRVYGAEAVERVRWITKLQDLGFTLNDIQDIVHVAASESVPREAMARVRGMFTDKLTDVAAQIRRLQALQRELSSALAYLESCQGCSVDHAAQVSASTVACAACAEHGDTQAPSLIKGLTDSAAEAREPSGHETAARKREASPSPPNSTPIPSATTGRNR